MNTRVPILAATLACGLGCVAAQAQDNVVKAGLTYYTTNSSTNGIQGIGIPPGADAETGNAVTAIFVYERTLTPNIGVELVLGIPPTIEADATGSVAFLGDNILSAKNVSPTLLVNYTRFTDIKSSLAPQMDMSDSWGLALQAGINYAIDKHRLQARHLQLRRLLPVLTASRFRAS